MVTDRDSGHEPVGPDGYADRTSVLSIALHEAAIPYVRSDWGRASRIIGENLAKLRTRARGPLAHEWIDEWESAWAAGPEGIVAVARMRGERGNDLRQMTPLAGVLPFDIRADIAMGLRRVS